MARSAAERFLIVGEDRKLFPPGWVAVRAKGARVTLRHERSGEERTFFDLIGGYGSNNLGHGNRKVLKALATQAAALDHVSALANRPAAELARRLVALCGFRRGRCYFVVGGSQAVEVALRIARWSRKRPGVAVLTEAFHGYGSETLQLSRDFVAPELLAQLPQAQGIAYLQKDSEEALEQLERNGSSTAALLFEPLQGAAGFREPRAEWLRALIARANAAGAMVIADEIQAGLGRAGKMLSIERALPSARERRALLDAVLLSKSLAGGAHGLSAIVLNGERIPGLDALDEEAALGETFTNSAPGCAAALAVLDQLGAVLGESVKKGAYLLEGLRAAAGESARGLGMALALDFESKAAAAAFSRRAWDRGLLCYVSGGRRHATVKLIPPLNLTWAETRAVLVRLAGALRE